jgi:hypothetical protein
MGSFFSAPGNVDSLLVLVLDRFDFLSADLVAEACFIWFGLVCCG